LTRFFVLCPCVCSGPGRRNVARRLNAGWGSARRRRQVGARCTLRRGAALHRAWRAGCRGERGAQAARRVPSLLRALVRTSRMHAWTALTSISVHTSCARPWCLAQGRRRRQQQQQQQRKQRKKERRRRQRGRGATHAAGSWRSTWTAAPRAPRAFTKGQTAARRRLPRTRRHTCCRRWSAWLMAPQGAPPVPLSLHTQPRAHPLTQCVVDHIC